MKTVCSLLFIMVCALNVAEAATCRAGEAAMRGGQAGYETDAEAAEEVAEKTLSFADVLEQCIGSISSAKTSPTFGGGGGLVDMLDDLVNKVCRIARQKIEGEGDSDRKTRMAAALQKIYRDHENRTYADSTMQSGSTGTASYGSPAATPSYAPAVSAPSQSSGSAPTSSDVMQSIWR